MQNYAKRISSLFALAESDRRVKLWKVAARDERPDATQLKKNDSEMEIGKELGVLAVSLS